MREKIKSVINIARQEGVTSKEWKVDAEVDEILTAIVDYIENIPIPSCPFGMGDDLDALQMGCFYRGVSDMRDSIIKSLQEL